MLPQNMIQIFFEISNLVVMEISLIKYELNFYAIGSGMGASRELIIGNHNKN